MTENATEKIEAPKKTVPPPKSSAMPRPKPKAKVKAASIRAPEAKSQAKRPESSASVPVAQEQPRDALSVPQARALAALLKGATVEAAARAADVSRATVHRWLKQPDFSAVFRTERVAIVDRAASVILTNASDAARVMVDVMNDKKQPASVRLRAALAIQDAAIRWREIDELAPEIERIKAILGLRDAPQTSQALEF
jgi:hypothetical protein